MLLLAAVSAGFGALGVWMAGLFGPPMTPGEEWVGWMLILFFGPCTLLILPRSFDSAVQVRIDGCGIFDQRLSLDTIPWSEISDVSVWAHRRSKFIVLHLREPQRFTASGWTSIVASYNRRLTGGDVTVNLTGTDRNFGEAMQAIESFRS